MDTDNQPAGDQHAELANDAQTPETVETPNPDESEHQGQGEPLSEEEQKQQQEEKQKADEADRQSKIDKRIAKLTWEKKEAEREANRLREQLNPAPVIPSAPPALGEYQYIEDFEAATQKYYQDLYSAQQTQQQRDATQQSQIAQQVSNAQQIEQQFIQKTPDYLQVASQMLELTNGQLPPVIQDFMLSDPNAPAIIHKLGKDISGYADFLSLSPQQQYMRLGALSAQTDTPATQQQRTTPKPPPPVSPVTPASTTNRDPAKMNDAEWQKWREAQLKKSK